MIDLIEDVDPGALIKVIGAGGCGGNAIHHMISSGLRNVEFIAVNTDTQALQDNSAPRRIQFGQMLTRGRGTGGNSDLGRKAALEDEERFRELLSDAGLWFITAGLAGGPGTGARQVIQPIGRE